MAQYIPKSALVAEIERRRESNAKDRYFGRLVEDNYFLDFLDTIEVKEVDLNDAFIEKAWHWIEDNMLSSNQQDKSRLYCEEFKRYMGE